MDERSYEFEGTWDELLAHAKELSGKRLRVSIVPVKRRAASKAKQKNIMAKGSTARALLKHAGTWCGDDMDACLKAVYANRTRSKT